MPRSEHSAAFRAVRDQLIALDDADRRPLARLLGAMHNEEAALTPGTIALLRAIAGLDTKDVLRLQRWAQAYLNRWGQVPSAASQRIDPRARRDVATTDPPT